MILNDLAKFTDWRISLTGGEPTYYKHLKGIVEVINKQDYYYSLTTNGLCPPNFLLDFPKLFSDKSKLHVSIDGNKETHEFQRGKKTYSKALAFLAESLGLFPNVSVTCVLYFHPKLWIDDFVRDLDRIGCKNITFISPVNDGRFDSSFNEQYREYYNYIEDYLESQDVKFNQYFLDFNSIESSYYPITFIDAEGIVTFPHVKNECEVKYASIYDQNIAETIFEQTRIFSLTKMSKIV
jgi:sulfatase maturation enzyme AslB (radical SAM superfamily)